MIDNPLITNSKVVLTLSLCHLFLKISLSRFLCKSANMLQNMLLRTNGKHVRRTLCCFDVMRRCSASFTRLAMRWRLLSEHDGPGLSFSTTVWPCCPSAALETPPSSSPAVPQRPAVITVLLTVSLFSVELPIPGSHVLGPGSPLPRAERRRKAGRELLLAPPVPPPRRHRAG